MQASAAVLGEMSGEMVLKAEQFLQNIKLNSLSWMSMQIISSFLLLLPFLNMLLELCGASPHCWWKAGMGPLVLLVVYAWARLGAGIA